MATLSAAYPTLLDVARRLDPDGKIAKVAEILNKYNEVLDDLPYVEGNLPTGHKTTVRGNIPAGTWRLINQGIVPVKSTTNQITEGCGMLENYSEVDKDLALLNGNSAEWRMSEDMAIIEGLNQSLSTALFYGDTSVNTEQFVGFGPRYWTKTLANSATAYNVIDGGGSSTNANTSVWLVGWSENTAHAIYPKGSKAGLSMQDLGEQTIYDASMGRYQAYRTHYQMKAGLCVRDWRFVVRIANLDVAALATSGDTSDTSANLLKLMSLAIDRLPPAGNVRPVFYCNQTVRGLLRVKMQSKSNIWLDLKQDVQGASGFPRPTLSFQGLPVRRVDAITNTEAALS